MTFSHYHLWLRRSWVAGLALLPVALLMAFPARGQAQQQEATLSGFVSDSATKEKMISATVAIRGTKLGALTNKQGMFTIKGIAPGSYIVTVSFVGYRRIEQ